MEELDKQYMNVAGAKKQEKTEEKQPEQKSEPTSKYSFGMTAPTASSASSEAKPTTTSTTSTTTPFGSFKFGASEPTSSAKAPLFGTSAEKKPASSVLPAPAFNFTNSSNGADTNISKNSFNFTQKSGAGSGAESNAGDRPLFLFGQSAKNADDGQKSAAPAAPFSFMATGAGEGASAGTAQNVGDDDDDAKPYEPPKAELVENEEPDAIFSMKCKMFFMKDGTYVEKGVGTFHLKPLEDSSKTQVLIRAATATGTVLLNVSLSSKMPTQRVGKNNVSMVCVPHPALDPKHPSGEPATLLIRVKSGDDADKLLAKVEERKKLAD
uniref:RanBD1 domain-containing protein n=1 Tax=Plectus sambesii TaxID=2011161 RepID=A0A914VSF2_9BILA